MKYCKNVKWGIEMHKMGTRKSNNRKSSLGKWNIGTRKMEVGIRKLESRNFEVRISRSLKSSESAGTMDSLGLWGNQWAGMGENQRG